MNNHSSKESDKVIMRSSSIFYPKTKHNTKIVSNLDT